MRKLATSIVASSTAFLSAYSPVLADTLKVNLKDKTTGWSFADLTLPMIISGLIRLLVIAAAVIFFFWLVLGGIKWIVSGGDKAKTEEARNQITAALIGLVIVFSAWAIAQLINVLFGVDLFNLEIQSLR